MRTSISIFVLGLAACGERRDAGDRPSRDGGMTDVGQSDDPAVRFCHDLWAIRCARSPTCCSDPTMVYESPATCATSEVVECLGSIAEAPVYRQQKATLDTAGAAAILGDAMRAAEGCTVPSPHAPPLVGTLARGDDCTFTLSDGFFLACQPGLFCVADSVEGDVGQEVFRAHCGTPKSFGATCIAGSPFDCAETLYCDELCKPRRALGSSCLESRQCERPLACNPSTMRCEERILPADEAYCFEAAVPAGTTFVSATLIRAHLDGKTLVMEGAGIPSHPNGVDERVNNGQASQCYHKVELHPSGGIIRQVAQLGVLEGAPNVGDRGTCDRTESMAELDFTSTSLVIENVRPDGSCFDLSIDYPLFGQEGRGKLDGTGSKLVLELYYRGRATGHRCGDGDVGATTVLLGGAAFTGDARQSFMVR